MIKKRTNHRLTKEYCKSVAKQCTTTNELWTEHRSVAQKAQAEGWYDSYKWLSRERVKRNTLTEEECLRIARKCKSIRELREKHASIYATATKHGWLNNYTWLTRELAPKTYWTVESVTNESRKYTTKKDNGKFILMVKVERFPGIHLRHGYTGVYQKFHGIAGAKFNTFYDAIVAAKVFLDWIQEPLRDAELFTDTGAPCYSVRNAKFSIKPNESKFKWTIRDLDEGLVLDAADTREEAIKKMIDQGTYNGAVLACI